MMQRMIRVLAGLLLGLTILSNSAYAESRVALVIGNSAYKKVPALPNPQNDATDIAVVLKRLGFKVNKSLNLTYGAMRRALRDFGNQAIGADIALVYFAGHGIEVNRQNYLIPVDAALKTDLDVEFEAITLDLVMSAVRQAKGLRVVLLDACRNNPFATTIKPTSAKRSIGRGLARVEPSVGTLVSYAAKEGTTADDGKNRNSPYTSALLDHLEQPGLEVQFLFRKVRDKVLEQTGGRQEPFTYGSLPGRRIFLKPPEPETPGLTRTDQGDLVWLAVKDTRDVSVLERFVTRNPNSAFADTARQRIELLALKQVQERAEMREQIAWAMVKNTGDLSVLQAFVARYPNSKNSSEAKGLVSSLRAAARGKAEKERLQAEAAAVGKAAEEKRRQSEAAKKQASAAATKTNATRNTGGFDERAIELAFWQSIANSQNVSEFEEYLRRWPDGAFVVPTQTRIKRLKIKVAALSPADAASPEQVSAVEGGTDAKNIARKLQTELRRVGCNPGPADGSWGRKSKTALIRFNQFAKTKLATHLPSMLAVQTVGARKKRVCPKIAKAVQPVKPVQKKSTPTKTKTSSTIQPATRAACRAGSMSACRSRCKIGGQRACLKVKCMQGQRSACSALKKRKRGN